MKIEEQENVECGEDKRKTLEILYKNGDWRAVLHLLSEAPHDPHLLWLRPHEQDLAFIINHVTARRLMRVVSLGCGTGLFEWLLQQYIAKVTADDLEVMGVEVDQGWWSSPHAPPTFLPLSWVEDSSTVAAVRSLNSALVFCYFNCEPAWRDYLAHYPGPLVIVCGPIEGSNVHSDPRPFQPLTPEWTVVDGRRVGQTKDFIAIYARI